MVHRSTKAFSLLELVIVLAIIGVLAAIAAARFSRATDSARFSTALAQSAGLGIDSVSYSR